MKHLRHRVTIQRVTQSANDFGEPSETWSDLVTVWAKVECVSGGEEQVNGTTKNKNSYVVEMWYRSDLTTKDRLSYIGAALNIDRIENVKERNRKLKIYCSTEN